VGSKGKLKISYQKTMEKITTLALLHRGKLQRIHDAPPDSTTGLLQQVRTLSAAPGWERGKTWKEWEGIGRIGKNMKTTNF
jgi:hypothetical protein